LAAGCAIAEQPFHDKPAPDKGEFDEEAPTGDPRESSSTTVIALRRFLEARFTLSGGRPAA